MENSLRQYLITHCPLPLWLRRLGFAGFLFFFLKGMAWIAISLVAMLMTM